MTRKMSIFMLCLLIAVAILAVTPRTAMAQITYTASAGGETKDQAVQADAFLPNEFWLLEGDSIQWTFAPKNEIHTVTFLMPGQARPMAPPPAGPPFAFQNPPTSCTISASPATYDGSACVSSAPMSGGATFSVTFPTAGNYKLVCLVHTDMNGTVHVLDNTAENAALLHSQRFYDDVAQDEENGLLLDHDRRNNGVDDSTAPNAVTAGIGEIIATGGGLQYRAVVRFLSGTIRIHKGDSVLWTNLDPTEPHTVTFGTEPDNFVPTTQVDLGAPDADGTLSGEIDSTGDFLNSGFLQARAPDRTETPQLPPGVTRIRITFPKAGVYKYHCALHDVDGMVGTVIVLP